MVVNIKQQRWHIFLSICAITFSSCKFSSTTSDKAVNLPKSTVQEQAILPDSVQLPFLFYPERWFLNNKNLFVLNIRNTPFLSIYDISNGNSFQWGKIGNGPNEYVFPSLCKMKQSNKVGIYMNEQNRLDIYTLATDTLLLQERMKFPVWNEERGIPKAYTRLEQFDDSLFVGTSFMPREISVELLNMKSAKVTDEAQLSKKPLKDEYSGPYECKVSVNDNIMAVAYRYFNRLEIFSISPEGFKSLFTIGDSDSQHDLYKQDRDNEMVYYYSDIACGANRIYALYQGVQVKDLSTAKSILEVYTDKGEHVYSLNLGQAVESIVVDERAQVVYANNPAEDKDILFRYSIPVR